MKTVIPGKLVLISFISLIALGLGLNFPPKIEAYIYGEESPRSQLVIDKKIKVAEVNDWQDNLPSNQIVLQPDELVDFKIIVRNSGDQELSNIKITDYLPSYLKLIFGPGETAESQELTWKMEKLAPGQEESFKIRAQIKNSNQATKEGVFCLMNKVRAEAETGEVDEDTASFCLVGAKKLPQAGSHNLVLGTLIAGLIGGIGLFLRKFGRGEILS